MWGGMVGGSRWRSIERNRSARLKAFISKREESSCMSATTGQGRRSQNGRCRCPQARTRHVSFHRASGSVRFRSWPRELAQMDLAVSARTSRPPRAPSPVRLRSIRVLRRRPTMEAVRETWVRTERRPLRCGCHRSEPRAFRVAPNSPPMEVPLEHRRPPFDLCSSDPRSEQLPDAHPAHGFLPALPELGHRILASAAEPAANCGRASHPPDRSLSLKDDL